MFLKPLAAESGWSAGDVSLSFTALMSTAACTAIVVGKAQQYVSARRLLLAGAVLFGGGIALLGSVDSLGRLYGFALLAGIGLGVIYPGATMTPLMHSFPEKKGLASGLLTAGYGLGPVVWAPVSVFLIERLGLRWTMRSLGLLLFLIIAGCSLLVRTGSPVRHSIAGEGASAAAPSGGAAAANEPPAVMATADRSPRQMLATLDFWVFALLFVMGTTSGMMVVSHASPIAQDILGISPEAAGAIVAYLALGMVAGKLLWGVLSDRVGRYAVFAAMLVAAAAALLVMSQAASFGPLVAGICVVGLCYGGFLALIGPVTADVFGPRYLGVNFGIMFLTVAIAAFVGPRLAAEVSAASGDYNNSFVIAAVINLVALSLLSAYLVLKSVRSRGVQRFQRKV